MSTTLNLADQLEMVASRHSQSLAVACGDTRLSFAELYERVCRIASGLRNHGVAADARILTFAANCHRFVELYWAAAFVGAAVVPVEARLTDDDISYIAQSTNPQLVVADTAANAERLRALLGEERTVLCFEEGAQSTLSFDDLLKSDPIGTPDSAVNPHTPALIVYTAATEGRPKGAVITHANLLAQAVQTRETTTIGPHSRHGVFLPLTHTFGAYLMYVATCSAVANTVIGSFDAERAVTAIGEGLVSFYATFAPMGERILRAAEQRGIDLGQHLEFATGLEVPSTIAGYHNVGVPYYHMYGQTEAAGMVSMGVAPVGSVAAPNYSGIMMNGTRLSLRDELGNEVRLGEAGEAWLRGATVVERYWPNEPTRLTDSGWLKTGDIMRREPDGRLYFMGRTGDKDLIKPGGLNVYPAEVEHVLRQHPAVLEAFVFGTEDPTWRERVCAIVMTSDGVEPARLQTELRELCVDKLASYKRPAAMEILNSAIVPHKPMTRLLAKEYFESRDEPRP
jgi:long-chain acyl-CoA synthetase